MAALSGAAIGAAAGGIAGGLIGMGIPEIEAKRYEGKLQDGNILISVHTENTDEITRAWSGLTTKEYKQLKSLKKENLRDNMTNRTESDFEQHTSNFCCGINNEEYQEDLHV